MKAKLLIVMLLISSYMFSQKEIKLYDGKPEGSEDWDWSEAVSEQNVWDTKLVYNVVEPTITAFLPKKELATGTAIIIAPGGGYHALSIDSEGNDLAKWLQSKGVAAFVLKYRLARSFTDEPAKEMSDKKTVDEDAKAVAPLALTDGLTAIKYVRDHAKELNVNPNQIGFIGFSAGGNLTVNVAYNGTKENRPNFIAPIYAWDIGEIGGVVPKDSMPAFVGVATDDPLDLMPYSLEIYKKWVAAGQPAELHAYQTGGHGFGMRTKNIPTDTWYERFGEWLHLQGYIEKLEQKEPQNDKMKNQLQRFENLHNDYAQLERYKKANEMLKPPKAKEKRVVFLGNSITEGWVNVDSDFFEKNNFIGRGISGQTSPQLLLRFRQDVIDLKPKAVVLHIGTNDIAENTGPYNPEFTMSNIKSMVNLAKANDIKVILAAVLPATEFSWRKELGDRSEVIVDLNNRIKAYAKQEKIPFVDYHTALKNDKNGMDKDIAADGVHPTEKGYEIMKGLVLPVVQKVLK